jgi:exodeoxyribonuclease VII large subunit
VKVWNTGHLYFSLKDSSSILKGLMFRSALRYLKFKPTDGLKVVARGKISVYEPKGEYQIVCEHLEPQGLGALQLAFDQLKKRLQAEGLFDVAKKRPLPALPRKIGVVTSLDGAAIRDILKVLRRRYKNVHVVIRPTKVQGEGAAAEIAHGLRQIVKVPHVDVVIVPRGGRSMEDLWAFGEGRSRAPLLSRFGHRRSAMKRRHDRGSRRRRPRADAVGARRRLVVARRKIQHANRPPAGAAGVVRALARAAAEPPRPRAERTTGAGRIHDAAGHDAAARRRADARVE